MDHDENVILTWIGHTTEVRPRLVPIGYTRPFRIYGVQSTMVHPPKHPPKNIHTCLNSARAQLLYCYGTVRIFSASFPSSRIFSPTLKKYPAYHGSLGLKSSGGQRKKVSPTGHNLVELHTRTKADSFRKTRHLPLHQPAPLYWSSCAFAEPCERRLVELAL